MHEQDTATTPTPAGPVPAEPADTGPAVAGPVAGPVAGNPKFVVLALHLRDAWNAARKHGIRPDAWTYPRTVAEARDLETGRVIETRRFAFRSDAREFRLAVRHLRR